MRSFWKRSRPESLEDRLRSNRPEPRTEFLRNMTTHIRGKPQRRRRHSGIVLRLR